MSKPASRTKRSADRVYEQVKSLAITFGFRPGERINEVELAKRFKVSRTPLREALGRLVTEGFLSTQLNKGFSARSLDPKEVFNLYEFRDAVESAIVSIACQKATAPELDELERFVRASMAEAPDALSVNLLKLDEEFHERLARVTRNDEFLRTLRNINFRIHFVRWIDMQSERRVYTQKEHLQIVQALKKKDAELARQLIHGHISRRLDQIVDVIRAGYAEIYMGNGLARQFGEAVVP